jgi:hypothetical protein
MGNFMFGVIYLKEKIKFSSLLFPEIFAKMKNKKTKFFCIFRKRKKEVF